MEIDTIASRANLDPYAGELKFTMRPRTVTVDQADEHASITLEALVLADTNVVRWDGEGYIWFGTNEPVCYLVVGVDKRYGYWRVLLERQRWLEG
jgi:hypothetical protein